MTRALVLLVRAELCCAMALGAFGDALGGVSDWWAERAHRRLQCLSPRPWGDRP